VREAAWQKHQAAGPGLPGLVPAEPFEVAVQDEECFVAVLMDVRGWGEPGGHPVVDDARRPCESSLLTLLIISVFRNQNACPSSERPRNHSVSPVCQVSSCASCLRASGAGGADALSVKSNETVSVSLFGWLKYRLVDPGLGWHGRRVRPAAEPLGVGVPGGGEGVLPGPVDRAGGAEVHRRRGVPGVGGLISLCVDSPVTLWVQAGQGW
jgi:hypothetical protein